MNVLKNNVNSVRAADKFRRCRRPSDEESRGCLKIFGETDSVTHGGTSQITGLSTALLRRYIT